MTAEEKEQLARLKAEQRELLASISYHEQRLETLEREHDAVWEQLNALDEGEEE